MVLVTILFGVMVIELVLMIVLESVIYLIMLVGIVLDQLDRLFIMNQ